MGLGPHFKLHCHHTLHPTLDMPSINIHLLPCLQPPPCLKVFPDYRERVIRHEAAHLLVGYLMGIPVTNYSLMIGQEHTEFAESKIQKRLIERVRVAGQRRPAGWWGEGES